MKISTRKICAAVLTVIILMGLVSGCGNNAESSPVSNTAASTTEPAPLTSASPTASTEESTVSTEDTDTALMQSGASPAKVISAVAGHNFSLALKDDGTLWTWGVNDHGQLGDGTTNNRSLPQKIMDSVVFIAASDYFCLAVKTDGTLWGWGDNTYKQLTNAEKYQYLEPTQLMDGVKSAVAGNGFTLAVKNDDTLWGWGSNISGTLNTNENSIKQYDTPILIMDSIRCAFSGSSHVLAIKLDDSLWGWGSNQNEAVGDKIELLPQIGKNFITSVSPVQIMDSVKYGSAFLSSFAIKTDGSLWAWGNNEWGTLGVGQLAERRLTTGRPIKVLDSVKQVSVNATHSMAVTDDGELFGWGNNEYGQLGTGSKNKSDNLYDGYTFIGESRPVKIMDSVSSVSSGLHHTLIIKDDGSLWACGDNTDGELGDGTTKNSAIPIKIIDGIGALDVAAKINSADLSWQSRYFDFIKNGQYLTMGNSTYDIDSEYKVSNGQYANVRKFSLHDMDNDGVPELIVLKYPKREGVSDVYTIRDDGVVFLGETLKNTILSYSLDSNYHGLFYNSNVFADFPGTYYFIENGTIAYEEVSVLNRELETVLTYDQQLYTASKNTTELKCYEGKEEILAALGTGSGGAATDLTIDEVRAIVRNYVPQEGLQYAKSDIPDSTLERYIEILREKGFDYDEMLLAYHFSDDVQKKTTKTLDEYGFFPTKYDVIDNMEYEYGVFEHDGGNFDIVISFNGTELNFSDLTANTNSSLVDETHKGYKEMAQKLSDKESSIKISTIIRGSSPSRTFTLSELIAMPSTRFFLTGHSMGGAIAQAYAIHLLDEGVSADRIIGYTFNSALPITTSQRYYAADLKWFNIMNRTDNVSAGAVWFSLECLKDGGVRLGYDIPLNDPKRPNMYYEFNTGAPNGEHAMWYLWDVITADANRRVLEQNYNGASGGSSAIGGGGGR